MQVLDLAAGYHGAQQIPQGIARRRLSSQDESIGPDQAAARAVLRAAKARAAARQAHSVQPGDSQSLADTVSPTGASESGAFPAQPTNSQSLGDTVSPEVAAEDGASTQDIGYATLGTATVDTESMAHKAVSDVAAEPLQAQAPPTVAVS